MRSKGGALLLEIEEAGEPGSFRLKGEMDLSSEERVTSLIEETNRSGREVSLDLSEVTFMDSSGLRVIIRAALSSGPHPIVLVRPSKAVRRVLDLSLPNGAPGLEIRE